jgi:DNA-binding IclR family transcriptional regulator
MTSRPSHESVSSAENVLLLLVALRERGRLRVADAAELLSVTPPTAHRLLATLKRHEFAEQDRQRAYRPGPRLTGPEHRNKPLHDLSILAHPHLVELSQDTGETTHLVVLQGNGCRFIDGVDSSKALRVGSRVGLLLPAHTTSGGKVLLAQLPDPELLALYPDGHVRMRDGSLRDLAMLRRELATVRRYGYALNLEASERGVNAVGVPLTSPTGRVVAAVVLASPALRSSRRELISLVPRVQATAAAIAKNLDKPATPPTVPRRG